ncbi:hypothetical protein HK099_003143 [Clydaea vesicula]|uniref:Uncharacterized protein n=1 Tax=Clydaea vesicula TaxID=447962 RepID=A0AAD5Y397_9FUNG|nr:hypothetical protein HK099_003143 [Clydaea vesicula]KAJ3395832.1 hypothetical protein HDU92_004845 [Lobulomyces angularis]
MILIIGGFLLNLILTHSTELTEHAEHEQEHTQELIEDPCHAVPEALQYDVNRHVIGLFLVLVISGVGIFSTLILGDRKSKNTTIAKTLQLFKMFGIGIIAATAWIHLLPGAFEAFTNPCLPETWSYGPGFVGVFGLFAAYSVQIIELVAHHRLHKKNSQPNKKLSEENASTFVAPVVADPEHLTVVSAAPVGHNDNTHLMLGKGDEVVRTVALEAGILFHSLVIGLTLGVAPDSTFTVLLVAICFHQFFEGMALGVLVGELSFTRIKKFFGMGLIYPLTTPIGILIGILVHKNFNENLVELIILTGIFESLSAGILFYNTYAELMSLEINNSAVFAGLTKGFKFACFLSMYLGSAVMAIIGLWA